MNGTRRTVLFSLVLVAAMVGLVAVSVPLYRLFCRATGAGGTPRVVQTDSLRTSAAEVTVRFDASVMHDMPWRFQPEHNSIRVRLGETQLATFIAENHSDQPITGTASFNVTPAKAGPYVDKIACFCFSEQRLEPGQRVEMPVSFYIDPAIADDPTTSDVHTITLSYTFFKARNQTTDVPPREGKKS